MCAQPSSVSSVHSTHNSSLEMASGAGPSSQAPYASLAPLSVNASTVHSDPSTPLRPSCQGCQQQQQQMAAMHSMSFSTNPYASMTTATHPQPYSAYPAAFDAFRSTAPAGFARCESVTGNVGTAHYLCCQGTSNGLNDANKPCRFSVSVSQRYGLQWNVRSSQRAGAWPRYPQGMAPFGGAAGNPAAFPVGPSATEFMFNSAAAGYFSNGSYPFQHS
ncbi:hypothetical protein OSTOST_17286 [Ostertagia ostertagi]